MSLVARHIETWADIYSSPYCGDWSLPFGFTAALSSLVRRALSPFKGGSGREWLLGIKTGMELDDKMFDEMFERLLCSVLEQL